MSKTYTFTVTKVQRHDEQRDGPSTQVIVKLEKPDGLPAEHTLWIEGWHDTTKLATKIEEQLQKLSKDLSWRKSETDLVGRSFVVEQP